MPLSLLCAESALCLHAAGRGDPIVVTAALDPPRVIKVYPVLSHFNADTPAHATVACALHHSAEKGCGRCWITTYKSKQVAAPIDSEEPSVSVPLSSNAYGGFVEPAKTQPMVDGQLTHNEVLFSKQTVKPDGGLEITFDRDAAKQVTVSNKDYIGRAKAAEKVKEEELHGYHEKCVKTKTALPPAEAESAFLIWI